MKAVIWEDRDPGKIVFRSLPRRSYLSYPRTVAQDMFKSMIVP